MMPRCAVGVTLLAACAGLALDRQSPDAGQPGQQGLTLTIDPYTFGAEAAEAEAAAVKAAEKAAKVESEVGADLSERQLDAIDRRATAEVKKESMHDGQLQNVIDAMRRETAAKERAEQSEARRERLANAERDRQFAEMERKIRQVERMGGATEEEREWKKEKQVAERHAKMKQREQEREEAHQEWEAQQVLRQAQREINAIKEQEKAVRKAARAQESETADRLLAQAENMRKAASNGTLPHEEVLRLLDISEEDLHDITSRAWIWASEPEGNSWFTERVEGVKEKSAVAAAHLLETIEIKTKKFVNTSSDYDDTQFVNLLSRYLDDIKSEVKLLEDTSVAIGQRIQGWDKMNPEKLSATFSYALDGVKSNIEFKGKILQLNTNLLGHSNATEACDVLGTMLVGSLRPAQSSLESMKDKLDNMTKVMPSIASKLPGPAKHMVTGNATASLMLMAYTNHVALKEASQVVMTQAAPMIVERLHNCTFRAAQSDGVGRGLSVLSGALAAAAAWLAL